MQSVPSKSTSRLDLIFPRRRHGIFESRMKVLLGETAWNQSAQLAEKSCRGSKWSDARDINSGEKPDQSFKWL